MAAPLYKYHYSTSNYNNNSIGNFQYTATDHSFGLFQKQGRRTFLFLTSYLFVFILLMLVGKLFPFNDNQQFPRQKHYSPPT